MDMGKIMELKKIVGGAEFIILYKLGVYTS